SSSAPRSAICGSSSCRLPVAAFTGNWQLATQSDICPRTSVKRTLFIARKLLILLVRIMAPPLRMGGFAHDRKQLLDGSPRHCRAAAAHAYADRGGRRRIDS